MLPATACNVTTTASHVPTPQFMILQSNPFLIYKRGFNKGVLFQDVETIERLNETGELRRILKPYKVRYLHETFPTSCTCYMRGDFKLFRGLSIFLPPAPPRNGKEMSCVPLCRWFRGELQGCFCASRHAIDNARRKEISGREITATLWGR